MEPETGPESFADLSPTRQTSRRSLCLFSFKTSIPLFFVLNMQCVRIKATEKKPSPQEYEKNLNVVSLSFFSLLRSSLDECEYQGVEGGEL